MNASLATFGIADTNIAVIAGLVPAIHGYCGAKAWTPGTSPGMTALYGSKRTAGDAA